MSVKFVSSALITASTFLPIYLLDIDTKGDSREQAERIDEQEREIDLIFSSGLTHQAPDLVEVNAHSSLQIVCGLRIWVSAVIIGDVY